MKRFGLIGITLKHSFSKKYFTQKFIAEQITDCSYENFEIPTINELPELIEKIPGLTGINVTIPYKETCVPFLNKVHKIVEETGACNCIKIINEKLYGYNTDVAAFKKSLEKKLKPHHQCALILGSGGASKAIQYGLKELNIEYTIISRHKKENQPGYEDVGEEMMNNNQIIINTTPLGMYPNINEDPPIPYDALSSKHLLFDLTYNPPKTKFLSQGAQKGAEIINGYDMLVMQAEESWRIWNDPGL